MEKGEKSEGIWDRTQAERKKGEHVFRVQLAFASWVDHFWTRVPPFAVEPDSHSSALDPNDLAAFFLPFSSTHVFANLREASLFVASCKQGRAQKWYRYEVMATLRPKAPLFT